MSESMQYVSELLEDENEEVENLANIFIQKMGELHGDEQAIRDLFR